MCGIVGAFDLTGRRTFSIGRLRAMCAAMAHRGPDDEQVHLEPGLAMGVRRLAIVDLDGGRQPLTNESGTVRVAFNGELFEYPELFAKLQSRGHRFKTRCDTEIWVHLYEDFGERVFEQAKGQFAVSLWDSESRKLLLARDRMGICPLYYTHVDGWLLWASEIKSLLASGLVEARPDAAAIDHLFCTLAAPSNRSFFAGVKSLPAGHALCVRDGSTRLIKYWDLDFPDANDKRPVDENKLVDELDERLRTSIRRRLRGDVPVVGYLSGGVDSSLVLALASKESSQPVPSYTVSLHDSPKDELGEAAGTAAMLGSPLTPVLMTLRDLASGLPQVITAAEGPAVDPTCSAMIRLSQHVHADGFKVALTGEGADEGLAGYPWFRWQWLQQILPGAIGERLHTWRDDGLLLRTTDGAWKRSPFRGMNGVRTIQQATSEFGGESREVIYSPEMWLRLAGYNPYDDMNLTNDRISKWHPLNRVSYVAYRSFLAGLLLSAKGDRSAMHSSVETRPPFLDEDVVEFCSKLPTQLKLRRGWEKYLLRRVAERYLPRHVAWRRKHMFNVGSVWSTARPQNFSDWAAELLSQESLRTTQLFDPAGVQQMQAFLCNQKRETLKSYSPSLGLIVVLATQLWHHIFCGGNLCSLPSWTPPRIAEHDPVLQLST